ncbi:MAG: outer membrane protein [Hyphomicrobiales bacterium]
MRMFKTSLLAGAMLASAGFAAQAADPGVPEVPANDYQAMGFYLRGDIGWSFLDWSGDSDDDAFVFGAGAGYRFNDNMRADLRVDWAGEYDVGPGADLSVSSVLGNLYFDWTNDTSFTPYMGAGLGYGWTNASPGNDKDGVAYGLMAGVAVDLTDSIVIDAGYRFRDVMVSGSDPTEHQFITGLRFEF